MPRRPPAGPLGAPPPENYERFFVPAIGEPVALPLLHLAALRPGERVLDVGCGTGIVTRLAARTVGESGETVGIDLEPGMLAVARSAAPPSPPITWRQANATTLPFDAGRFDAALCQMVLQFVEDRPRALAEMRRVLAPGGRVVLGLPGPAAPMFEALAEGIGRHIRPEARGFVERVFSLHAPAEVEALLARAGFREVEVQATTCHLTLPAPRDFLRQYVGSTPLAGLVGAADLAARDAFEADVVGAWESSFKGRAVELEQPMTYARGFN